MLFVALVICGAMAEFTAKDMHSLKRLGDFAVSSSGKIVYTVSKWVRFRSLYDVIHRPKLISGRNPYH